MKKFLSVTLALVCLLSALMLPVYAEEKEAKISLTISSDICGLSYDEFEKLIEINNDCIKFSDTGRSDPINITDVVGNIYLDKFKAGRTYGICYNFVANDGYVIPDKISEEDISIICDPGVNEYWHSVASGVDGSDCKCNYFFVWTEITVKGNFFQNLFGRIADFFLKIKSWSPY